MDIAEEENRWKREIDSRNKEERHTNVEKMLAGFSILQQQYMSPDILRSSGFHQAQHSTIFRLPTFEKFLDH